MPTAAAAALQLATFVLTGRALGPETFGLVAVTYAIAAVAADVAGLGGDAAMVRERRRRSRAPRRRLGPRAAAVLLLSYPPVAVAAIAAAAVLAGPGLGVGTVALLVGGEVLVGRATAAAELVQVALGRPAAAGLVRLAAVARPRRHRRLGLRAARRDRRPHLGARRLRPVGADRRRCCSGSPAGARLRLDRGTLGFGLLLMLNGVARSLAANLDRIVLAALLPPAALGLYAAGSRLQLVGAIANQAATRILYPRFFRAAERRPRRRSRP